VDALVERLDARLREWAPETAAQVRERLAEVMDLANHDVLDLMRPRGIEQEILDLLDEPTNQVKFGWPTWDSRRRQGPS
jgi:hypothetical protein